MEVITFYINNIPFGTDIKIVDGISKRLDIVEDTQCDTFILGSVMYRNELIRVIDLSNYLFGTPTKYNENSKIMVCIINKIRVAFILDNISNIININDEEIIINDGFLKNHCCMIDGYIKLKDNTLLGILNIETIIKELLMYN